VGLVKIGTTLGDGVEGNLVVDIVEKIDGAGMKSIAGVLAPTKPCKFVGI
jgi:hypothetical protein